MKKAVSPVIATLLLILIAVAAAVLVYVWVTGYATSITSSGTPELRERIKVEAVSYSDDTLTIYVRNVGDVSVTIDSIYVMYAENSTIVTMTTTSRDISVNDVESISVSVSLATDTTYIVKVVTTNGVEAASTFTV